MFGYVKVNSGELRVREYEMYRGAYCGLCRSMGRCTGQCSRMMLSYDFAFLVSLRICLENTQLTFKRRRCLAHPFTKRSVMESNDVLDYCARSAAILAYHKVKDDLADERGLKKLCAVATYPFVAAARKKAVKAGLCELDRTVGALLCRLSETEGQRLPSVDTPAQIFGDILAEITAFGLEGTRERIARELGRAVGRWIYTVDAIDDMSEDSKKGRYNPFLLLYGGRLPSAEELCLVSDALKAALCSGEAALDLMDTDREDFKSIVDNIMFLGLPKTAEQIIDKAKSATVGAD